MPYELAFKTLGFMVIWFSMLLALAVLLLSQAKENHTGKPFRHAFSFALAVLDLCAMIGWGAISTNEQKVTSFSKSVDRT